jgi:hypothetical protein
MNPRIAVPLFTTIVFSIAMALTGVLMAPEDVWPNVLLAGFFLVGIGLAGGFVVAVHDASNGRWLGPMRRIACSFTRLVLPGSLVVLAAIGFGGSYLYPAFHGHHLDGFKGFWMQRGFFTARAVVYLIAWLLSIRMLRHRRGAPVFLVVFAVTVWLASVDWIMALEEHFASTMFGVYHFAGLVTAGLAAIVIVAVSRSRADSSITSDHIHDAAKMLFAFSTFWMYIWFSQGMLIWYGNLSEETPYYLTRAYGNWGVLFWATVILMWALPFLVLLPESTKRNRTIVTRIAVAVLIGHWLDLYISIVPAGSPEPRLTGWELALALGTFAAVGWAATRAEVVALEQQRPAYVTVTPDV